MWYPGGDSVPGKDDMVWVAMAKGLRDGCGASQLISVSRVRPDLVLDLVSQGRVARFQFDPVWTYVCVGQLSVRDQRLFAVPREADG